MFLHGSAMHLVFNMMALYTLGGVVERLHGSLFLAGLLLVSQVVATLTQMSIPFLPINQILNEGPIGIGASGAVFGVFGFVWIRPKIQLNYPVEIPQSNVIMMLGFLIACMTPLIAGIANGAHLGGLLTGIVMAWLWPK
jgi:GlpG protein